MTQRPVDPRGHRHGSLRPTPPTTLLAWGLVGMVVGWLVRPVAERLVGAAPIVTWSQVLVLHVTALALLVVAWYTWRALQGDDRPGSPMPAYQAVNRLLLARACAYVGALVAGGYLGYAVSWLGLSTELAEQRLLRSLLAAVGGITMVIAALLVERACRVRADDDQP